MNKKLLRNIMRFIKKNSYIIKYVIYLCLTISVLMTFVPMLFSKIASHIEPNYNLNNSSEYETVQTPRKATIYRTDSRTCDTIVFEDYIMGVVACEMPATFHQEALKAQAVAARTYSTAKIIASETSGNPSSHPNAPLCDSTHCQVYKSEKELKSIKGSYWIDNQWPKVKSAVNQTSGQLLYYDGQLVKQALFHSSSGGKTENSEDVFTSVVPYLVSVESPYEDDATHQNEKTSLSIKEFEDKIRDYESSVSLGKVTKDNIKIVTRSSGNRVEKIQVGKAYLTGKQIREALSLPSSNFSIKVSSDRIIITSNGSGHGVGMSQYGANGMAKEGYGYKKILSHYYSGTEVH